MISFKSLLQYFETSFTLYVGGGGQSSGPTNTTVQNTNLPSYAQPYVESMLGSAQQNIFNSTTDANGNVTLGSIKPYQPAFANASDYFAGPAPMQQQAYSSAANLQTPGQFGQASQMAGMSGMGSMGIAGQAAQAGNQYANSATNGSIGAYMNPYLQQSLAPQLALANQQYGMAGQTQQGQATTAGAFGGSREALMEGLNQQNQMLAQNQIIGNGYNTAFNNAQQAQQFGANLGLQGQQTALQGLGQANTAAQNLGQLGTQQLAAQQGIIGTQNQLGSQQQAAAQNVINQQVQNYATAQQYPMMQLANMSNLLHGLPLQSTTTQSYQASPSVASQLGGLGATALGAAGAAGAFKAKGGIIKMKSGGLVDLGIYNAMKGVK